LGQQASPQAVAPPTDPGTNNPKPGQDLGRTGGDGSPESVKEAFKSGLREAWRTGNEWDATDWIVNRESTWKPDARNGKYYGLGQFGPDVWKAAGVAETDDPAAQGKVFDHYVGGRYELPTKAKTHWEANNWYRDGGSVWGPGSGTSDSIPAWLSNGEFVVN